MALAVVLLFVAGPALLAGSATGAIQEDFGSEVNIPVRALLSQAAVPAGGDFLLAVIYDVPPKAHIQINEFLFAMPAEGEPFTLGEPLLPATVMFEGEPVFQGPTKVFFAGRVAADAAPGARRLRLTAGHQACMEEPTFACFAPVETPLELEIEILPAGSPARPAHAEAFAGMTGQPKPPGAPPGAGLASGGEGEEPGDAGGLSGVEAGDVPGIPSERSDGLASEASAGMVTHGGLAGRLQEALARKSFLAFFLVFLGGVATSFTPCVYPMIPITISYIGGRSRSKLGGLFLSVFFVLGIALTYSTLGVIAASTGALFGSAMQSTAVIIGVSLIFLTMGASMLGAFDLALPAGFQTRLQSGPRGGVLGALFMGMVTGLVASPCVGPVVVVLLTWVAQMGSVFFGFLLLFVFALGLGLLFLVLGTFAGALQALPAAGQWMDSVKHIFGVILLAMAIYYLRPLLGPNLTWLVTGAFVVLVGTFLGAFTPVGEEPTKRLLFQKGFGIVLLVAGSFSLLVGLAHMAGLSGGLAHAPGLATATGSATHEGLDWVHDDEEGRSVAVASGKPALIDFYADWCTACKELDEKTWSDGEVRREGERFVAIKLDLTKRNEWSANKQSSYGVPGLPTVILFDSSGEEVSRFFGFKPASEVLGLMQSVR